MNPHCFHCKDLGSFGLSSIQVWATHFTILVTSVKFFGNLEPSESFVLLNAGVNNRQLPRIVLHPGWYFVQCRWFSEEHMHVGLTRGIEGYKTS
jgi:hypothetical protein